MFLSIYKLNKTCCNSTDWYLQLTITIAATCLDYPFTRPIPSSNGTKIKNVEKWWSTLSRITSQTNCLPLPLVCQTRWKNLWTLFTLLQTSTLESSSLFLGIGIFWIKISWIWDFHSSTPLQLHWKLICLPLFGLGWQKFWFYRLVMCCRVMICPVFSMIHGPWPPVISELLLLCSVM